MAEKWVWLGDSGLLDGAGVLQENAITADHTVFPFLVHDDQSNKYELRLLVRESAAAVFGWFRLFGGVEGPTGTVVGPTIPNWKTLVLPAAWRWNSASAVQFANGPPAFSTPGTLALTDSLPIADIAIVRVTAKQPTIGAASFTLVLEIEPSSTLKPTAGTKLQLTLKWAEGKLSVNQQEVSGDGEIDLEIPVDAIKVRLRTFDDPLSDPNQPDKRIGVELPLQFGASQTLALGSGIGSVTLGWSSGQLLVRLHVGRGAGANSDLLADVIAAQDNGPVCNATFRVPLVEATSPADRSDSASRLLLTKQKNGNAPESFDAFEFNVELNARGGDAGKPLLRFRLLGGNQVANLAETRQVIRSFPGKFLQHAGDAERVLTGVVGKLDGLKPGIANASVSIKKLQGEIDKVRTSLAQVKSALSDFPLLLQLEATLGDRKWVFIALARLDIWSERLKDNRIYVSAVSQGTPKERTIDLDVLALVSPESIDLNRFTEELKKLLDSDSPNFEELDRDGYVDVSTGELILDFKRKKSESSRAVKIVMPGGIKEGDTAYKDRVVLKTEPFFSDVWPEQAKAPATPLHLRLGPRGLSVLARVDSGHVAKIDVGASKPLRLSLERERGERHSELVVVNNRLRLGELLGKLEAPGFKGLQVDLVLGLRETAPDKPPTIFAEIDLSRPQTGKLLEMTVDRLRGTVTGVHLALAWNGTKWDTEFTADGSISFLGFDKGGGLSGLDKPDAFPFKNLDLLSFHSAQFTIPLRRAKSSNKSATSGTAAPPATGAGDNEKSKASRYEILDGLVAVEAADVSLTVDFADVSKGQLRSATLTVTRPGLVLHGGSTFDAAVRTEEMRLTWKGRDKINLTFRGMIDFELRIGSNIAFEGKGRWVDTPQEHYFAASGALRCSSFPNIEAAIKLGVGTKKNGKKVPNIVVYGSFDFEADLFPGVVLKNVGAGLSINNRLAALDRDPEPRQILARLDQLRPGDIENWKFDPENGLYVALVASAWLASNRGGDTVVNAYAMALTMIIDTNLDIIAAGEVWLFSSLKKIREPAKRSRPAMAGVIVFRPRKKTLSFVAETRPNPFIEANDQLAKVLSSCTARFSFYVSDELVDYFLEEVSYREEFLGVSVLATGGYRIAVGRFGVLLRAWLHLQGELPHRKLQKAGVGGFEFSGNLHFDADFGGLIAADGVSAYGSVAAGLQFRVSAFVMVPTPHVEMRRYTKTISFTISYPAVKCKRWGCRTVWRDETFEETIVYDLPVVVFRDEPYSLPEQGIDLFFAGDVGFDSGGQIGFRGNVSIDVSIFGHRLSISPRFDVRGSVIDKVKQRVAAVERSVNQLRNLPRPSTSAGDSVAALPAATPGPQKWTLYERSAGSKKWCVIVPSPEESNEAWYAPTIAELGDDYANFPRDTTLAPGASVGAASATERLHPSPLRDTVVRMIVPIVNSSGASRLLDLVMPWDRANMDSLPVPPGDQRDSNAAGIARLRALKKLSQIEAELTAGAAELETRDDVARELERRRFFPDRLTVVRDPRIGLEDRRFWRLADQLERPDWAPPADFRPVTELMALGLGPTPDREKGDSSLQAVFDFERLREQGLRMARHDADAPSEGVRLLQTRASFLASVLNDFERFPGPDPESRYGTNAYDPDPEPGRGPDPSRQLLVERNLSDGEPVAPTAPQAARSITRRRLPFICLPDNDGKCRFTLNKDLLSGATDFDLSSIPSGTTFQVTWEPGTSEELGDTGLVHEFAELTVAEPVLKVAQVALQVPAGSNYQGVTQEFLFIELHPNYSGGVQRKIGLIFDLAANESVDLSGVRMVRNAELGGDSSPATNWLTISKPNLVRAVRNAKVDGKNPVEELHRAIIPLTPCQTFVPNATTPAADKTEPAPFPTSGTLRVRLPVRLTDEFFTKHFASANRLEVLRRFRWETAPTSLGEFPVSALRWSANGECYVMPQTFLAADEFAVKSHGGSWQFVDRRLQPGTKLVRYFLRAIPFGETARTIDQAPLVEWPAEISLFLPERHEPLPPLAIVFEAASLLQDGSGSEPRFALFDGRGQRFSQRAKTFLRENSLQLDLWVKEETIPLSGFYAPGDELTADVSRAALSARAPSDLPATPLPEDIAGKRCFGSLTIAAGDGGAIDSEAALVRNQGFTLRPGFRYRWYIRIRPATEALDPRVMPLDHFLVREIPDQITQDTRLLAVNGLELIGDNEHARITQPLTSDLAARWLTTADLQFEVLENPLCRSDLPDIEKKSLGRPTRLYWKTPDDGLDGGVELLFQDSFASSHVERRLVEVQSEAIFAGAQTDFRLAGAWQAHAAHASGQLWSQVTGARSVTDSHELWKYFVWTSSFNPLLSRLKATRKDVNDVLGELFGTQNAPADWTTLHQALANWLAVINGYLQSPLVLDAVREQQEVDLVFAQIRNLFLGLPQPAGVAGADSAADLAKYEGQLAAIRSAIEAIERDDPRNELVVDGNDQETEAFKQRLLDHEIASRLGEVIRGRLAIVDALRDSFSGNTLDLPDADAAVKERWPRLREWNVHLTRWLQDIGADTTAPNRPLSKSLVQFFGTVTAASLGGLTFYADAEKVLLTATGASGYRTNLEKLATGGAATPEVNTIGDKLARKVNEAAGLAAGLAAIRSVAEPRDWRLVRRPHHQLSPEAAQTGDGRADSLADYITPPGHGVVPGETGPLADLPPADGIAYYFNWLERMGFAIDLALVDEDNRYFAQRELIAQLHALDWGRILNDVEPISGAGHTVYILAGREPDTELPSVDGTARLVDDDDALGYTFVKLAVVPNDLLKDLSIAAAEVTVGEVAGAAVPLTDGPAAAAFGVVGTKLVLSRLPKVAGTRLDAADDLSLSIVDPPTIELVDNASGNITQIKVSPAGILKKGDKLRLEPLVPAGLRNNLDAWAQVRGLTIPSANELNGTNGRTIRVLRSLALGAHSLVTSEVNRTRLIVVEPWGQRWQTVPAVGGWSHVSHPAADRAGRRTLLAGRRVSRYEPFLRWLDPTGVQRVERVTGLDRDHDCLQSIPHRRRMLEGEEPRSLPVAIHSHPTRIEFLYRLPPSAAGSLLSAEVLRRTGFLECQVEFTCQPARPQNQNFSATLPEADILTNTATSTAEMVVDPVAGKTHDDLKGTLLLWPVSAPTQIALVESTSLDDTKWKLKLNRIVNAAADKRALAVRPDSGAPSPNPLCPQFEFKRVIHDGKTEYRILADAFPDALVGSPAIVRDKNGVSAPDAVFIRSYDPQRHMATLEDPPNIASGVLTVLRWESRAEAYPVPVRSGTDPIELFRHERLISLSGLPYYLKYQASVEPRFAADTPDRDPATPGTPLPSPPAQRLPGWIPVHSPRIEKSPLVVTLFFNRLGDALDARELDEAVRLDSPSHNHVVGAETFKLPTRHLLDRDAEYQLWIDAPPAEDGTTAAKVIIKVADIKLVPDGNSDRMQATITLHNGVKSGTATSATIAINVSPFVQDAAPVYWVQFPLDVEAVVPLSFKKVLQEAETYRFVAIRSGYDSPMVDAHIDA
jgi:hypothetical protein